MTLKSSKKHERIFFRFIEQHWITNTFRYCGLCVLINSINAWMKFHSILSQFACSYATSNTPYVFESSLSLTCVRLHNNLHRHRHHFWYRNRIKKKFFLIIWNEMKSSTEKVFPPFSSSVHPFYFLFQFLYFGWRKRDFSSDSVIHFSQHVDVHMNFYEVMVGIERRKRNLK